MDLSGAAAPDSQIPPTFPPDLVIDAASQISERETRRGSRGQSHHHHFCGEGRRRAGTLTANFRKWGGEGKHTGHGPRICFVGLVFKGDVLLFSAIFS